MNVCDTCLDAAREECEDYGLSPSVVAKTLGAEISDHICENRDAGRACGCGCRGI